jgi:serine/threonine protein kinase
MCDGLEGHTILKHLGSGSFGTVYLARRLADGFQLAIKIVRDVEKSSKVESTVLRSISHPFIVPVHCSFVAKQKMHICMEYLPGGNLYDLMLKRGHLPLRAAKLYVAEVALALEALHSRGIVYRDLKPENIMIGADGHTKLTDFGLASDCATKGTVHGTFEFLAPEIVAHKTFGPPADWWALGVLFFEMVFGRTPFYAADRARMADKIMNRNVIVPDVEGGTEVARLVHGLLQKDPARRFGFEELVKSDLFADMDFDEVLAKKVRPEIEMLEAPCQRIGRIRTSWADLDR